MRAIAVREDISDLILDAADRLLARYGYKKMTMDDVAKEVGIGKGTIYLHFKSKEEIALARVDRIVDRLNERLRGIAHSNGSAVARLRRMLLERVLFRFDSVQHYTESLSDVLAAIRPALLVRHNRHFDEEERVFAALLKEGKSEGEFVFKDITRELGKRKDVEAQAAHIAELLIKGLKSPGS